MMRQVTPHLSDDELFETYVLQSDNAHLSRCESCRQRFTQLAEILEGAREDAITDADAVFTMDRLSAQHDRILRKLERQGHPAEVVQFPARFGTRQAAHRLLGPAGRWIAGAAAAGLVAGLFLGFAVDRQVGTLAAHSAQAAAPVPAPAQAARVAAAGRDEQILTEIEDALTGPSRRVVELRTLDAMTVPPEVDAVTLPEIQEASFFPR